ncbi:hypothetical protein HanRHA438_Chr05g0230251 [Helianthus annuus]|uniref:Uncharacterized protein n=1 Tax=Helianthus annuus TaxID=4232 RepID=A0A9K3J0D1_HELAN|nr:hypothetical protein HanXRQr2_Chr05g0221331 [Helianthus annuus]KAJ0577614.1 hypothetical protein HanIR_Chr05g0238061 [Helianthus annuus]KAJ0919485.1 hypothetical protein HanRHA438_Chr05g0230251 [Helianthus annuus]KAJ0923263.1 hypothetical protein HanPSC8_Chr05g0213801 [Helianthus annuus]
MEEDGDEGELVCLEIKRGEKIKERKYLQVDRRDKKVLRGSKERMRSRSSTGSLDQIFRSIGGGGGG